MIGRFGMDELHVAETLSTIQVPASNVSKFKLFQLYINVSVSVKNCTWQRQHNNTKSYYNESKYNITL